VATYRDAFDLARRLLGDPAGEKFKEGTLLPLMAEAQRRVQGELSRNGMPILRGIQLVTVPDGTTSLTLSTTPALNSNFICPIELEEKIGGTTGRYIPMTKDERLLPDIDQTSLLRWWNWRGQELLLVGATRDVDVRISYEKELTAPSLMTDTIPIIGAVSALAYGTAMLAGGKFTDEFLAAVDRLISPEIKANQYKPVRRLPYRLR
jgi:hypothetical protein